jgi:hypothetical protein
VGFGGDDVDLDADALKFFESSEGLGQESMILPELDQGFAKGIPMRVEHGTDGDRTAGESASTKLTRTRAPEMGMAEVPEMGMALEYGQEIGSKEPRPREAGNVS